MWLIVLISREQGAKSLIAEALNDLNNSSKKIQLRELAMTCQPYGELWVQFVKMLGHKGWQWNADVLNAAKSRGFHMQYVFDISAKQTHEACSIFFFFSGVFLEKMEFYVCHSTFSKQFLWMTYIIRI